MYEKFSAEELAAWRKDIGWTQLRAAAYLGLKVDTYRTMEQGRMPRSALWPLVGRVCVECKAA